MEVTPCTMYSHQNETKKTHCVFEKAARLQIGLIHACTTCQMIWLKLLDAELKIIIRLHGSWFWANANSYASKIILATLESSVINGHNNNSTKGHFEWLNSLKQLELLSYIAATCSKIDIKRTFSYIGLYRPHGDSFGGWHLGYQKRVCDRLIVAIDSKH